MEPITGLTDSAATDETGSIPKRAIRTQDRVTLGKRESLKVDGWITQVAESTKGFLSLSRSDLVNYVVRSLAKDFSSKSLAQVRVDHYDPIRHLTWIAPQIKTALANGDPERVASLQAELRGVNLSSADKTRADESLGPSNRCAPKAKRRKRQANVHEIAEPGDEGSPLGG